MKGITPIISVVLLLLIAIAIIGLAASWFFSTTQDVMTETENATETQAGKIKADFRLEGSHSNQIYLRNPSEALLTKEALSIFINNNKVLSEDITMPDIEAGKVGTLIMETAEQGDTIDIYGQITHVTVTIGEIAEAPPQATCGEDDGQCPSGCTTGDPDCACAQNICEPVLETCSGTDIESSDDVICCDTTCDLDSDIIGMWRLDESGGYNVPDSTGANDGTIFGNPMWVTGKVNNALDFDGDGDYVEVSDDNSLDLGTGTGKEFTISLWFKTVSAGQAQTLIAKRNADSSAGSDYTVFLEINKIYWGTGSSSDSCAWSSVLEPSADNWHHFVGTLSATGSTSGNKKIYIDNVQVTDCDYSIKADSNDKSLFIGKNLGNAYFFNGIIDEITIWDRALDSTEVQELYNSQN